MGNTTIRISDQHLWAPISGGVGNAHQIAKQTILQVLRELKAKLYAQADEAIRATDPHKPEKIQSIQRRVDRDAARVAFAINLVSVKM
jgi:hypothetical protein